MSRPELEGPVLQQVKIDANRWLVLVEAERDRYVVGWVGPNGNVRSGISHTSPSGARLDFETRCVLAARNPLSAAG